MARTPDIGTKLRPYDELEALLRAGPSLDESFDFEHFTIQGIGMEVDRLSFSHGGMVSVDVRQATNQPAGLYGPAPFPGYRRPEPFSKDILVSLDTLNNSLTLAIQHQDGFRHSAINSGWRFLPTGEMNYDMLDFESGRHGPITELTKINHLEIILGNLTLSQPE